MILLGVKEDDFVICSGETHTIKEFVNQSAKFFDFDLRWSGKGFHERAIDQITNKVIVRISKEYFRPTEVNLLFGVSKKAEKILNWKPKTKFKDLVRMMCDAELQKYNKS